jgi:hypothetical protein
MGAEAVAQGSELDETNDAFLEAEAGLIETGAEVVEEEAALRETIAGLVDLEEEVP